MKKPLITQEQGRNIERIIDITIITVSVIASGVGFGLAIATKHLLFALFGAMFLLLAVIAHGVSNWARNHQHQQWLNDQQTKHLFNKNGE